MFRAVAFASTLLICNLSLLSDALSQQPALEITGNDLSRYCESSLADFNKGFCAGFITSTWYAFFSAREQRYFCDPPNATVDQAIKVVEKYLADHPEGLHEEAMVLVFDAWEDASPCPW
jgi:hypothetical protein